MEFENALGVLLGWIGQEVTVGVQDWASAGTVASFEGLLGSALEIDAAGSEDESLVFPVGPDQQALLTLDRSAFHGGEGDEAGLELSFGSVLVEIYPHAGGQVE